MLKRLQRIVLVLLVLALSCLLVPNAVRVCVAEFVACDQIIDLDSETETEEDVESIESLVKWFSKIPNRKCLRNTNNFEARGSKFIISNIYLDIDTPPPVV
jgi:hypothetical protein